ncbi:MAG TPA: aldehyde dehydrogenase [Bacteroidales bacterium]|nr:aldehyde dehydrogenase [Bacteroidales bacterium]
MTYQTLIETQKSFFNSNQTKNLTFRIEQLKKLKSLILENEALLYKAIMDDFGKSAFETYATELSLIYHEINLALRKVRNWSRVKRVPTNLANFPARSYVIPEPLGTVLVIGAWNYPYQLSVVPAIAAMAAGNTVLIKPSELPSGTSHVMAELINNAFDSAYLHVVEGGIRETSELLSYRFDKIFFTGSIPVGRLIYQAAAKQLTPVTLELGGKSPAFVFSDCNIKMTARRIAWAKFINAGQTCVAPDYILVEKNVEQQFLDALSDELNHYPESMQEFGDHYTRIINLKNYDRLVEMITPENVFYGGKTDREYRFISPTVLKNISFEDRIMEDEIFGPLLPVIGFTDLDKTIRLVKDRPKPLSCYVYSSNKKTVNKLLSDLSFGGGAVNDSVMHLSNSNLPFGGVGFSGIGSYHGKAGFAAFSHYKSILHKPTWFESSLKYPHYSHFKLRWIKRMMN